jgi:hypothetical protein
MQARGQAWRELAVARMLNREAVKRARIEALLRPRATGRGAVRHAALAPGRRGQRAPSRCRSVRVPFADWTAITARSPSRSMDQT